MSTSQNSDTCKSFGVFVRQRRKDIQKTARTVATEAGMLPSNYCKLEYGALQPPSNPVKLALLADALQLPSGEEITHQFYDLAGHALNAIPADVAAIISREEAMPMMLRTLGCRKITQEEIEKIINIIREVN